MPPKRFSALEVSVDTDGIRYWSVAEATVLDDLLRAKKYEEATEQLRLIIVLSQQIQSYNSFRVSGSMGFHATDCAFGLGGESERHSK